MCLSLACYRKDEALLTGLSSSDDPDAVKGTLLACRPSWPNHSRLQASVGSSTAFLAPPLETTEENFFDISSMVHGRSVLVKIDHQADMTGYVFVLYAHPPTPSQLRAMEERRANDKEWHDFLAQMSRPIEAAEISLDLITVT